LTLWRLQAAYGVPVLIFVNTMDQPGTDRSALMQSLKARLSDACVDLSAPDGPEEAALCGEEAMETYLRTGAVPDPQIAAMTAERRLFPCIFGSALKLKGIDDLLGALERWIPAPSYPDAFAARVYKISHDPQGARLTWLKVTGGSLAVRTLLRSGEAEEKISQIRLYSGQKYRLAESVPAGTVCAVTGLSAVRAGDGLGAEKAADAPLLTPVFTYQVLLPSGTDPHKALSYLRTLEEEDPQLHVLWSGEKREIRVQLMGEVQLEVLTRLLRDRFSLNVGFGEGSILYRETIGAPAEGIGHYEPLRHYAEVHLLLEPAPPGSGLHFASACPEDDLDRSWQRLILTHLMEKQHLGVLTGSPITDIRITLIAGRAHLKHTEGGDFRQATYRAVRQGLMQAPGILLEPWYDVRLELPQDCLGRAMNDLTRMGGSFAPAESAGEEYVLTGSAPVAALRGYAREVVAYTRGRGRLLCTLRGYAPCREQDSVVAAIGYDPERDTDNPADSVFCSHGAGYIVKWDQVKDHMHLPAALAGNGGPVAPAAPAAVPARITAADDKQLMAIFERTYGPVRERRGGAAQVQSRPTVNDRPIRIVEPGEEYLLVDGYNIIFAWPDLKQQAQGSLEDARRSLQDILSNYRGFRPCHLILVFDAYKVHGNPRSTEDYQGIHIVYTREAETADNYIERTIRTLPKDRRVRVATSDALEQIIIMGGGALRMSANEFRQEVESAKVEIDAILRRNNSDRDGFSNMEKAMKAAMEKNKNE
ncbi:MAG: TetM/TetW/TetO/TetS family tetracycline resistance ribosomal protection protein, partial [Clostridia bacterium]|nr:TetM/TetW/TetO/TetS family tetracycline resistance ribosomal protection protein [Clostridia bacterium]